VLEWIIKRCNGQADAQKTPIGYLPFKKDLDLEGLDIDDKEMEELLKVDRTEWNSEAADIKSFYDKFGSRIPPEMLEELEALKKRLE
jgi:phosphoenolpyruvate carboxykinase (GTP)